MKEITLTFICRITSPAVFSSYKGSMLRGALGTQLKKTCCTIKNTQCPDCILSAHCAFSLLFLGKSIKMGAEKTTLPPPYCIIPHDTGKTQYKEGEVFSFRLLLFSYAREYLPYFVHAMILAGIRGMGKSSESCKGTFEIDKILWNDLNIYQKEKQKVHIPDGKELIVPAWTPCEQDMGLLLVHLNSPCRFKNDNRLSSQLEFSQLLTLIIRRIRSLWELEGEHIQLEYFHEMMALAASISVRESFLFWKDWTRYSSRQGTSMQLGGLQGSIRYHGRIASFLPFLELAERIHIGKQTSFGLGQLSFEWHPENK